MVGFRDRCFAAIIGAAVADAAAQPIHWNYKEERLNEVLQQHEFPEFIKPSQNPFYNIETGKQTCYGDQAYVVLSSLVSSKGLNVPDMQQRMYNIFGPDSEYEKNPVNRYTKNGASQPTKTPIDGPWRQGSIKEFLRQMDAGQTEAGAEEDKQIDAVTKIAPVVALYAGKKEMLSKVKEMVQVTQKHDVPVAHALAAARILEYLILQGPKPDVLEQVRDDLVDPNRLNPTDLDEEISEEIDNILEMKDIDHVKAVSRIGKA